MQSTRVDDIEFALFPYFDVPKLGFERAEEFCMLTLRHPEFQGTTLEAKKQLYVKKKEDRSKHIEELFDVFDTDKSGILNKDVLKQVLKEVGLPAHDGFIAGLLQRQDQNGKGEINREEFPRVVAEAWGQVVEPPFSDKLHVIHKNMPDVVPLNGERAVHFVGRDSPAGWVLRGVRNMWPYALKTTTILRNQGTNPERSPDFMKKFIDMYEEGGPEGISTVHRLALLAAKQTPIMLGGLMIRLEHVAKDRETLYVPLRGLPENPGAGGVTNLFKKWSKMFA